MLVAAVVLEPVMHPLGAPFEGVENTGRVPIRHGHCTLNFVAVCLAMLAKRFLFPAKFRMLPRLCDYNGMATPFQSRSKLSINIRAFPLQTMCRSPGAITTHLFLRRQLGEDIPARVGTKVRPRGADMHDIVIIALRRMPEHIPQGSKWERGGE